MKTLPVLLCALSLVAALPAQAAPARTGAKSTPAAPPPATKEEEKLGTIDGLTLARPGEKYLGLTLLEGRFKLTFYDKKKKPMPVDVARALARWPNVHGVGDNRTVLNPAGDGTYLLGPLFVRGPFPIKLFLTLVHGDEAGTVEPYTVDFRP